MVRITLAGGQSREQQTQVTDQSIAEETKIALDTERKFEFYFAGLAFTILGLAVNNFVGYRGVWLNVLTFLSFGTLFASAVCAVLALQYLMKRHWLIADQRGWRDGQQLLEGLRASGVHQVSHTDGRTQPIEEAIEHFRANIPPLEAVSIKLRRRIEILQAVRLWAFLLGALMLVTVKAAAALSLTH